MSWLYVFVLITSNLIFTSLQKSDSAFPLTVFSFVCPGKNYLFPFPATFRFAWPCVMFSPYHLGTSCISALVQPLAVSSALCCTDHRAWPYRVLSFISFVLRSSLCHCPALSSILSTDYEVTNFSLSQDQILSEILTCQGIFQHVPWVFSILDIFSLNTPG
jgi:hypothetical protein